MRGDLQKTDNSEESLIFLSVVIPCYCSKLMIGSVVERVRKIAAKRFDDKGYEIVLVDDCSPDGTCEELIRLDQQYSNVHAVCLAKNFGQQAALVAGYSHTRGNIVISMDDDGQTPPEDMFLLLDKIDEGYDAVYASYPEDKRKGIRRFGTKVNDCMMALLLGKPESILVSSYCAFRRYIVEQILCYTGPYPYITGQVFASTSRIANVTIRMQERLSGESGYTIHKLFKLWLNGFTAYSVKPLRLAAIFSGALFILGFVALASSVFQTGQWYIFWCGVGIQCIISSMILLSIYLLGEYVGRGYVKANELPIYVERPRSDFGGLDK